MTEMTTAAQPSAMDRSLARAVRLDWEKVAWIAIVVLTLVTRLWHLGIRAMSHDESLHTYYAWKLFMGEGYQHDPMMHGPLLFHAAALSYFLFGVSDFTARLMDVVAGLGLVLSPLLLRKWLGPVGAVAAGIMLLVSPTITYYSRYIRHDVPVEFFTVVMIASLFRYLDSRQGRWVILAFIAATAGITTAEMTYINGFILVLSLVMALLTERLAPSRSSMLTVALAALGLGLLLFATVARDGTLGDIGANTTPLHRAMQMSFLLGGIALFQALLVGLLGRARPAVENVPEVEDARELRLGHLLLGHGGAILAGIGAAALVLTYGMGQRLVATSPAIGRTVHIVIIAAGLLFVYGLLSWLLEQPAGRGLARAIGDVPATALGIGILAAAVIYILLFTTFFTNPQGINGLTKSINYWLEQHDVVRGGQPWYYYVIFTPMYEFLPLILSLVGLVVYALRPHLRFARGNDSRSPETPSPAAWLLVPLLAAWAGMSLWIFSWAGEKMPWLIVHLVVPLTILGGRFVADAAGAVDWRAMRERGWQLAGLTILAAAVLLALAVRLAAVPAAADQTIEGLNRLSGSLLGLVVLLVVAWGIWQVARQMSRRQALLAVACALALVLFVMDVHYSLQANFVNDELATEYIVYAHGTPDDKEVYNMLLDMQDRLGVEQPLKLGYDNEVSWPFTWYFRSTDWPSAQYLGERPSGAAALKNLDVVLVGSPNYGKFEPYLRNDFVSTEYRRMWWPNEGYKALSLASLVENITNPKLRRNWLNILLFRRYTTDPLADEPQSKSLTDWYHHANMKMYVRKDLVNKVWPLVEARPDTLAAIEAAEPSTYEPVTVAVEQAFDTGPDSKPLVQPKDVALAPDGSVYVLDHGNARVVVYGPDGAPRSTIADGVLRYTDEQGQSQPSAWGIGLGPNGEVYIADTWNHRILKYENGQQTAAWGTFGSPPGNPPNIGEGLTLFYGPRDVAVGPDGNVYVADTGNKRIVVFQPDGTPLRAFGGGGIEPGQFDEPTSIAFDPDTGDIYVADLWNLRIQQFDRDFTPLAQWPVDGWESQDAAHKAYVAVGPGGTVVASEPSGQRIWLFDRKGKTLGTLDLPIDERGLDQPIGVAVDAQGRVFVTSSNSGLVTRYAAPTVIRQAAGLEPPPAAPAEQQGQAPTAADASGVVASPTASPTALELATAGATLQAPSGIVTQPNAAGAVAPTATP